MIRMNCLFMLSTLVLLGCSQPGTEVAWTGSTDQAGVPPSASLTNGAASDGQALHVTQKPVLTHTEANAVQVMHAVCVLQPVGKNDVSGTIRFERQGEQLYVTGTVKGLSPGNHGFHVHEFGDLRDSQTGNSAGGHFNPTGAPHGHQQGDAKERHAGDFGNIEAGDDGVAHIDFSDNIATLHGEASIIGHGIVIHAAEDKFTQPSGDAGPRVAFGVIGVANPDQKE